MPPSTLDFSNGVISAAPSSQDGHNRKSSTLYKILYHNLTNLSFRDMHPLQAFHHLVQRLFWQRRAGKSTALDAEGDRTLSPADNTQHKAFASPVEKPKDRHERSHDNRRPEKRIVRNNKADHAEPNRNAPNPKRRTPMVDLNVRNVGNRHNMTSPVFLQFHMISIYSEVHCIPAFVGKPRKPCPETALVRTKMDQPLRTIRKRQHPEVVYWRP